MRTATSAATKFNGQMHQILEKHEEETLASLQAAPHVTLLEIHYPELVQSPVAYRDSLMEFLGRERLPAAERMDATVCPELHHQRLESAATH